MKRIISLFVTITILIFSSSFFASADQFSVSTDTKMGDVNADESIDLKDVLMLRKYIAQISFSGAIQLTASDVNVDGEENLKDVLYIRKFIAKLIVSFDKDELDKKPPVVGSAEWMEQQVIKYVNQERAKVGLPAYVQSSILNKAVHTRALELRDVFDHVRPDGSSWSTVLKQYEIKSYTAGENIAGGYGSPESVVEAWMDSTGHRENILNPSFTTIAVGYDEWSNSWVQLFIG